MLTPALELATCPLCHTAASEVIHSDLPDRERRSAERFSIVRCRGCRHLYLSPRPTAQGIGAYYETDKGYLPHLDSREHSLKARLFAWRARSTAAGIAARTPAAGRILEIGCGSGRHLDALRTLGFRTAGVEPSPAGTALARRAGHEVRSGTAERLDWPEESFDTAFMIHVIEHLHDPLAALAEVRRVLRPTGSLFLSTPNADALAGRVFGRDFPWSVPRHLQFFTRGSLRLALEKSGWHLERSGFDCVAIDWIRGLALACGGPGGLAGRVFGVANPLWHAALAPAEAAAVALGRGCRVWIWARPGPP